MPKKDIPIRVVLMLAPVDVALLNAAAKATDKTDEQVIADALRLLFVAAAREGDA